MMKYRRGPEGFYRIPRLESQYSHSQFPLLPNIFSYWVLLRKPNTLHPKISKLVHCKNRAELSSPHNTVTMSSLLDLWSKTLQWIAFFQPHRL